MNKIQIIPIILIVISSLMIKAALAYPARAAFASHYVIFWALILIAFCIAIIFGTKKKTEKIKEPKKLLFLIMSVTLYLFAMTYIGFFISSAVFMIGTMLYLGVKNKIALLTTTTLVLGGIYFIFLKFLEVPVPSGILF